jgi:hypothetical protein
MQVLRTRAQPRVPARADLSAQKEKPYGNTKEGFRHTSEGR